jgi:hypothetical protein
MEKFCPFYDLESYLHSPTNLSELAVRKEKLNLQEIWVPNWKILAVDVKKKNNYNRQLPPPAWHPAVASSTSLDHNPDPYIPNSSSRALPPSLSPSF